MSAVPAAVARMVDRRDEESCVRCGVSLHVTSGSRHHRKRRAVGGHTVENLILLCGSGTTGCHGYVHAHVLEARTRGWIVPANGRLDPLNIPVLAHRPDPITGRTDQWFRLDGNGLRWAIKEAMAVRMLRAAGVIGEEA